MRIIACRSQEAAANSLDQIQYLAQFHHQLHSQQVHKRQIELEVEAAKTHPSQLGTWFLGFPIGMATPTQDLIIFVQLNWDFILYIILFSSVICPKKKRQNKLGSPFILSGLVLNLVSLSRFGTCVCEFGQMIVKTIVSQVMFKCCRALYC